MGQVPKLLLVLALEVWPLVTLIRWRIRSGNGEALDTGPARRMAQISFVQALLAIGFKPIPLSGEGKVVDIAIQRTAEALVHREADVVLVSHDGDFVDQVSALCDGSRQVGVVGFTEFVNSQFRTLPGVRILDLEYDIGAFNSSLPRIRIIPIDEFDPLDFL